MNTPTSCPVCVENSYSSANLSISGTFTSYNGGLFGFTAQNTYNITDGKLKFQTCRLPHF